MLDAKEWEDYVASRDSAISVHVLTAARVVEHVKRIADAAGVYLRTGPRSSTETKRGAFGRVYVHAMKYDSNGNPEFDVPNSVCIEVTLAAPSHRPEDDVPMRVAAVCDYSDRTMGRDAYARWVAAHLLTHVACGALARQHATDGERATAERLLEVLAREEEATNGKERGG